MALCTNDHEWLSGTTSGHRVRPGTVTAYESDLFVELVMSKEIVVALITGAAVVLAAAVPVLIEHALR